MKSGPVGAGADPVVNLRGPTIPDLMAKRSLRSPIAILFLIAVATVASCRNAVRRSMSLAAADEDDGYSATNLRILPSAAAPPPWNATLARMAAADPYEAEARKEVEDLLDVAGARNGREFTHRSIASWRRSHNLQRRKGVVVDADKVGGAATIRLHGQGRLPVLPEFRRALRDWSRNRWRHQPSIMSDLVSLIKDPVDRHRGGSGSGSGRKYASCAVVGNSGILLQHQHGALIDSHEFVVRLNNAAIAGYAAYVGTKTGLSFVNSNILHLCALRRACSCHPYGANVPMVMYICQPVHFLDYALCNASSSSSEFPIILVTDPRFDDLCSLIVKFYSLKRFAEETGKPPQEWAKANDPKMFHYSSGMQAVMLAAGVCDRVSLFGFGKADGAKHHYHTNQKKELDLHDYQAEYAFYRDLATAPHLIPFLADSAFKTPPVIVYS